MNRIALDLGFIQIYWYSIFIFLGVFIASWIILRECKRQKINEDFIVNLIFYTVICGLIGARIYYVAFNFDYYRLHPLEIFEVWNGGLAIHGGIIGGFICLYTYCKKYNAKLLKILDIVVVGLILGQAIGRWGNFFNQEAYGSVTSIASLQKLGIPKFIIDGMYIQGAYRQPAFLYESIWCIAGFIALLMVRSYKYLKAGQLTGVYLVWYSLGRLVIEGMRADSLMLGNFKMAQIISLVGIIIGILFLIFCKKGSRFDNLYKDSGKEEITF